MTMRKGNLALAALSVAIIPIIMLIVQLNAEDQNRINGHIANMESLEIELLKDIEAMNSIINAWTGENLNVKTTHGQLILENLRARVADGNIRNESIKNFTIKALFDGTQLNNRLLYVNSPEFISLLILDNEEAKKDVIYFRNQTIVFIKTDYIPSFEKAKDLVKEYKECMVAKRDINNC